MATAAGHRSQPSTGLTQSSAYLPPEELALLATWHPNVLIAGPLDATTAVIVALRGVLRPPVISWQSGSAFSIPPAAPARTLIVHDVAALSAIDQQRLHVWLQKNESRTQVVATTPLPLLALVETGQFDAGLYYALNVIYLEVDAPGHGRFVGPAHD